MPPKPTSRIAALFVMLALIGIGVSAVRAADTVIYATGRDASGRSTVTGTIVDFTGERLTLQSELGGQQIIPTDRVVEVRTSRDERQTAGDRAWQQGKFDEALAAYLQALRDERRVWVQRQLMARCVQCFQQLGHLDRAADAFLRLVQSDPSTQYFHTIPLSWLPVQPTPAQTQRGLSWMNDSQDPVATLISASWLLPTAHRAAALAALDRLKSHSDPRIALLAEAQSWRAAVVTASPDDLARWRKTIQRIEPSLRGGPYYVLGLALARHGQHDQAALALLRVPISHRDQAQLAAAALLSAGRELERISRVDEAAVLYREAVESFGSTTHAAEAAARLEQLAAANADN